MSEIVLDVEATLMPEDPSGDLMLSENEDSCAPWLEQMTA
jgi:hypothetical protein